MENLTNSQNINVDTEILFREISINLNQGELETEFYFYTSDGYECKISNDHTDYTNYNIIDDKETFELLKKLFNEDKIVCIEKIEKNLRDKEYENELLYGYREKIVKCNKIKNI